MQAIARFVRWLWAPIAALWGEVIGLRAEEIRSLSVMVGIITLFRGFDHMTHGDSLTDPHVVVTLICLVMTFGLAWQATHIKGRVAGLQVELGGRPRALRKDVAEDLEQPAQPAAPTRSPVPDDPE